MLLLGVLALGLFALGLGAPSRVAAHNPGFFHWDDVGGGEYQAVDKNGVPRDRFITYAEYQKMSERAAAGAIHGGGQVPKGFAPGIVDDGKAVMDKMRSTAQTGLKAKAWRELKSAGLFFTQNLKAAPLLTKLSAVGLAASALDLGWKIGGGEDSIWGFFFGGNSEDESYPTGPLGSRKIIEMYPRSPGDTLTEAGGAIATRPLFQGLTQSQPGGSLAWKFPTGDGSNGGCAWFTLATPAEATLVEIEKSGCGGGTRPEYIVISNFNVSCIPGQTTEGCAGKTYDQTESDEATTPLEGTAATEAAEECFRGEVECGPFPGWWYTNDPNIPAPAGDEEALGDASPFAVVIPKPGPTEVYEDYADKLVELELVPDLVELDLTEADTSKEKGVVIIVVPDWGTAVDPGSDVEVQYNPDYRVIPAIGPLETYTDYAQRLEEEDLAPQSVPLPDYATDPNTGPDGASYTIPKPGTVVAPGSPVKVHHNPSDAPYPPEEAAPGCAGASVDPINIDPLGQPVGEQFPFGVFGWFVGTLSSWGVASEPPEWVFPLGENIDWKIDFAVIEPYLEVIRLAVLLVSALGFVWFLAMAGMGRNSEISSE